MADNGKATTADNTAVLGAAPVRAGALIGMPVCATLFSIPAEGRKAYKVQKS
jgi:hypothetical protein